MWQQGKSKVFLRESTERELEELRRRKLHKCAVIIQCVVSGVARCVDQGGSVLGSWDAVNLLIMSLSS